MYASYNLVQSPLDAADALYVQFLSDRAACGFSHRFDQSAGAATIGEVGTTAVFSFGLCATTEDVQEVLNVLASTPWDSSSGGESISGARGRIANLCRLDRQRAAELDRLELAVLGEVIALHATAAAVTIKSAPVDELDSYVSLVREAGNHYSLLLIIWYIQRFLTLPRYLRLLEDLRSGTKRCGWESYNLCKLLIVLNTL